MRDFSGNLIERQGHFCLFVDLILITSTARHFCNVLFVNVRAKNIHCYRLTRCVLRLGLQRLYSDEVFQSPTNCNFTGTIRRIGPDLGGPRGLGPGRPPVGSLPPEFFFYIAADI